jgi:hypothetical protein
MESKIGLIAGVIMLVIGAIAYTVGYSHGAKSCEPTLIETVVHDTVTVTKVDTVRVVKPYKVVQHDTVYVQNDPVHGLAVVRDSITTNDFNATVSMNLRVHDNLVNVINSNWLYQSTCPVITKTVTNTVTVDKVQTIKAPVNLLSITGSYNFAKSAELYNLNVT